MPKKQRILRVLEHIFDGRASPHPIPQTLAELEDLVQARNRQCTCSKCSPRQDLRLKCIRHPHFALALPLPTTTNQRGNTVLAPPKLSSRLAWPAQAPPLIHTILSYMDQPPTHLNDTQLTARASLLTWRNTRWASILTPYPHPDGRILLPVPEMLHLWQLINTLFFGGPIPHLSFRWKKLKHGIIGRAETGLRGTPSICMHPTLVPPDFGEYATLDFLSTLVHECIHAFLQYYPCWWCRAWDWDYGDGGHGRIFQVLAMKMEEVFPRLVGLPVRLGRFESVVGDFVRGARLPSVSDLEAWRLGDGEDEVMGNADARGLIERTRRECLEW